jgi:hypothetical protein
MIIILLRILERAITDFVVHHAALMGELQNLNRLV